MAFTYPTISEFKSHFSRDFPYGLTNDTIMDSDITKAIAEAKVNFNEGLWDTQENFSMSFLYLTAHYLVMDIRASTQGISGNYPWLVTSKSVGSVSEGSSIPDEILKNPTLAMFGKTYYGAKYIGLIFPLLIGNIFCVGGGTQA